MWQWCLLRLRYREGRDKILFVLLIPRPHQRGAIGEMRAGSGVFRPMALHNAVLKSPLSKPSTPQIPGRSHHKRFYQACVQRSKPLYALL